ncbi:MAG: ABC transporter ATP-binding protein [Verrucomicrobiota bacterium]|nr:MAG: ABC transporter ATP-binding protein [Verrucomicrobiota bacterium]
MPDPLLSVRELSIRFRDVAQPTVSGISFDLFPKKTLALVGGSGSGKTLIATNLVRLSDNVEISGKILFEGRDVLGFSPKDLEQLRRCDLAYIFQEPALALNPSLTIGYQLREIVQEKGAEKKIRTILEHVGFQDISRILRAYPHELSGGMQQRAMIALALVNKPKILVADEPTTALDVVLQKQILDLIRRLQQDLGFALLLITHDFALLPSLADEVCVLSNGKIIERGTPQEILKHPQQTYTRSLVESIFTLPRVVS